MHEHAYTSSVTALYSIMIIWYVYAATIDVPMPGPVGVQLVNNTPMIDGGRIFVNFVTEGPTDTLLCELGDYSVVEDCKLYCLQ